MSSRRSAGLVRLMGASSSKIARAEEGDTVAFQKLESVATGDRFAEGKGAPESAAKVPPPPPTQSAAIHVKDRKDEVRLAAALAKLTEEDSALTHVHDEIELQLIGAERRQINDLFRDGKLKDESRRRIERELDLREAHLANQRDEA